MNGYQYFSKSGDVLTLVYRTLQGEKEEIKITVQNIRVHPTYIKKMQTEFPTREAAAQFTSYDLGTIDVQETTPAIPFVSVSHSKILNNTTVTLTGYGCERYNQEPSYRFKISEKIIQKTENTTFILSALDRNLKTGSAGCEGDSGAPVYSKKNQVILLTGINSMSYGLLDLNDDNTIHYQQNVSTEVTRLDSAPIQKWLSSRN